LSSCPMSAACAFPLTPVKAGSTPNSQPPEPWSGACGRWKGYGPHRRCPQALMLPLVLAARSP
jgi:hypothetical protein